MKKGLFTKLIMGIMLGAVLTYVPQVSLPNTGGLAYVKAAEQAVVTINSQSDWDELIQAAEGYAGSGDWMGLSTGQISYVGDADSVHIDINCNMDSLKVTFAKTMSEAPIYIDFHNKTMTEASIQSAGVSITVSNATFVDSDVSVGVSSEDIVFTGIKTQGETSLKYGSSLSYPDESHIIFDGCDFSEGTKLLNQAAPVYYEFIDTDISNVGTLALYVTGLEIKDGCEFSGFSLNPTFTQQYAYDFIIEGSSLTNVPVNCPAPNIKILNIKDSELTNSNLNIGWAQGIDVSGSTLDNCDLTLTSVSYDPDLTCYGIKIHNDSVIQGGTFMLSVGKKLDILNSAISGNQLFFIPVMPDVIFGIMESQITDSVLTTYPGNGPWTEINALVIKDSEFSGVTTDFKIGELTGIIEGNTFKDETKLVIGGSPKATLFTKHIVTDCTFDNSYLYTHTQTSNKPMVMDIYDIRIKNNELPAFAIGDAIINMHDITGTNMKSSLWYENRNSSNQYYAGNGSLITNFSDVSLTASDDGVSSEYSTAIYTYTNTNFKNIQKIHIKGFDTGISFNYGNVNNYSTFAGEELVQSYLDNAILSDIHITDCLKGIEIMYNRVFADLSMSDVEIIGRDNSDTTSIGVSIYGSTVPSSGLGSVVLNDEKGVYKLSKIEISGCYAGTDFSASSYLRLSDSSIKDVNIGIKRSGGTYVLVERCELVAKEDADTNSRGITSASTPQYVVDSDITGFYIGSDNDGTGGSLLVGCNFIDNSHYGIYTYQDDIIDCYIKNGDYGIYHGAGPTRIHSAIIDGDRTKTIGVGCWGNGNTYLGISRMDEFVDDYFSKNEAHSAIALSERNLTNNTVEIKNCSVGAELKTQTYMHKVHVHDCGVGAKGSSYLYLCGQNLVEYCDVGLDVSRTDNNYLSYGPETIQHCGIGIKAYEEGWGDPSLYLAGAGSIGDSDYKNTEWMNATLIVDDCDIGITSSGSYSVYDPKIKIQNCNQAWLIDNNMRHYVNITSLQLINNHEAGLVKSAKSLRSFFTNYLYLEGNDEQGVLVNGDITIQEGFVGDHSPIFLNGKESSWVIFENNVTAEDVQGRITFDISEGQYIRGYVVGIGKNPGLYRNAYMREEGWIVREIDTEDLEDPEYIYYGDPDIHVPESAKGYRYIAVIFTGCDVTYDYETNGGDSWSGSEETNVISYEDGYPIDLSYTASKEGYRFLGWSTDSEDREKILDPEEELIARKADITLYAMFEKIINVEYDYETNGGTSMSKDDAAYETAPGQEINLSYTATKEGYDFVGWNTDQNAHGGLEELVATEEDDTIVLYAIYKKDYETTYHTYDATLNYTGTTTIYNNDEFSGTYAPYNVANSAYPFGYYTLTGEENISIGDDMTDYVSDVYVVYPKTITITYMDYDGTTELDSDTWSDYFMTEGIITATHDFTVKDYEKKQGFIFKNWSDGTNTYTSGATLTTGQNSVILTASGDIVTTEPPVITVDNKTFMVTLTPGNIEYDELDKIYYSVNGDDWIEYTEPFPVTGKFHIYAYQVTKNEQIQSDTAEYEGYELPSGIDATYEGDDLEVNTRVPKRKVKVIAHYPNSGDKELTEDEFELEDDIITEEGPNEVTVKHTPYPEEPDCPEYTDTVDVTGIIPVDPAETEPPIITVSPDYKVTLEQGEILHDILDKIYYRVNGGEWTEYDNQPFPVYKKFTIEAYQTTFYQGVESAIATVSGVEYPSGIRAEYTGEDKPVGTDVTKEEVIVWVDYPNSPSEQTTDFTLTDTTITHEGLNDVGVQYTEYPDDPNCPTLTTTVGVNGYDDNPEENPVVTTDPPVISVSKDAKATLTPGEIVNDTLGAIYYCVNGGAWQVYTSTFPVYKTYVIEAYQVTKEHGVVSEKVSLSGKEMPTGITAEYTGDYKDVGEDVDKDEVIVTVHWPNSPDEVVTDFTLPDPTIHKKGSNDIEVVYNPYPGDKDSECHTSVDVIGVLTPEPTPTEEPTTEKPKPHKPGPKPPTTEVTTETPTTASSTVQEVPSTEGITATPAVQTGDYTPIAPIVFVLVLSILGLISIIFINIRRKDK